MDTRCVSEGQREVGIIEHEGRTFVSGRRSVEGKCITGYDDGEGGLTSWCGKTMFSTKRSIVAETYRVGEFGDRTEAVVYQLPSRKDRLVYIVGYSLGKGMLFRGELFLAEKCGFGDNAMEEAAAFAEGIAAHFIAADAEDEEKFKAEMDEESNGEEE
jgi:hypothetical protein